MSEVLSSTTIDRSISSKSLPKNGKLQPLWTRKRIKVWLDGYPSRITLPETQTVPQNRFSFEGIVPQKKIDIPTSHKSWQAGASDAPPHFPWQQIIHISAMVLLEVVEIPMNKQVDGENDWRDLIRWTGYEGQPHTSTSKLRKSRVSRTGFGFLVDVTLKSLLYLFDCW